MSGRMGLVALLAVAAAARAAAASPDADLALRGLPDPAPDTLRMRTATADDDESDDSGDDDAEGSAAPEVPDVPAGAMLPSARGTANLAPRRDLAEKVVFRFNLGVGLDGGQLRKVNDVPQPNFSGGQLTAAELASIRAYSFGDAIIGTRGLGVSSLSTYLAAHFRFDTDTSRITHSVPSVHDSSDVNDIQVRIAYAEADQVFERRLLRPFYARAGRQFRYGAALAHFDGLTLGYDTDVLALAIYGGQRVALFGFDPGGEDDPTAAISGWSARLDLFELTRRVPIVFSGSGVRYNGRNHFEAGLGVRLTEDIRARAAARILGGNFARQSLDIDARISEVTTLHASLHNRTGDDWIYDVLLIERPADPTDARRYLNFEPPRPRLHLDLRGGTVFLDNIDFLVRGGAAIEHGGDDESRSTYSPGYLEGGAALEVRLRRSLALGGSGLFRYLRRDEREILDTVPGDPDVLPVTTGDLGERWFLEMGTRVRYSQGARRFSAQAEGYFRLYDFGVVEIDEYAGDSEFRGGARFSVDAWAGEYARVKVEYDVSSRIRLAPEIRGLKRLRLMAEGHF